MSERFGGETTNFMWLRDYLARHIVKISHLLVGVEPPVGRLCLSLIFACRAARILHLSHAPSRHKCNKSAVCYERRMTQAPRRAGRMPGRTAPSAPATLPIGTLITNMLS